MKEAQINRRTTLVLCLLLALPGLTLVVALAGGEAWRSAIRPSGDVAAKLLVLTLAISPLRTILPDARWTGWLVARRRVFGLATFGYSVLHLLVFCASIGRLDWIVQGLAFASMWTGWAALVLLAAVASVSNRRAQVRLGAMWKRIQRLVYPTALLVLAHWLLLSASPVEAGLHAGPLLLLWLGVAARRLSKRAATPIVAPK